MEVQIVQNELSKALETVIPAVATRSPHPILTGVLIQANENGVSFTATNLDITIMKEIQTNVEDFGSAVVNARLLFDVVKKLRKDAIVTLKKSGRGIRIISDGTDFAVNGFTVSEYPEIRYDREETHSFSIDGKILADMIRNTEKFASDDVAKGVLQGIMTEVSPGEISMVSVDGHRLAVRKEIVDVQDKADFLIIAPSMREIMKIATKNDIIDVEFSDKGARFTAGDTSVIVMLLQGAFIDYKRLIPSEFAIHATVDKKSLFEALDRVSLLSLEGKNNLAKFSLAQDSLHITSESEQGRVDETIDVEADAEIEIGFNTKYFLDVLKSIDDDTIQLNMNTSNSACIISSTDGSDSYTYLILPVRLS